MPFVYLYLMGSVISGEFRRLFSQYTLKKYVKFTSRHYAKGGLGYFNCDQLTNDERAQLYLKEKGRIAYFIDHNKTLVPYNNGDTFLDAGCGKGQNIQVISERYPASKITGFDISPEAVKIIQCGVGNNPNVSVDTGDLCSREFLSSIPDGSYNHVIVSHVLGFLSGPGIEETKKFRQELIDELIRISSDSVIILDLIENVPEITAEIEQNNRCIVHDRLIDYFFPYVRSEKGEVYAMFSDESGGLLYLKRK
jgi:SAM-dependent methyltransferase